MPIPSMADSEKDTKLPDEEIAQNGSVSELEEKQVGKSRKEKRKEKKGKEKERKQRERKEREEKKIGKKADKKYDITEAESKSITDGKVCIIVLQFYLSWPTELIIA